ncbi:AAA family ATPase, partial [Corynebacterium sp. MC-09]|nr:AAA family ATPase [Corynebacterium parakroppenstedtii]
MTTSSTQRGYGYNHQTRRDQLLYNHVDGTPCDICGQPMYRDKERNPDHATLEADHREGDKTHLAYRLLHPPTPPNTSHSSSPQTKPTSSSTTT